MVGCAFSNFGCQGGYLFNTIDFLMGDGVTTEDCLKYEDKYTKCTSQCSNPDSSYEKYYCKPGSLTIATNNDEIMEELMTNGPMMVGL